MYTYPVIPYLIMANRELTPSENCEDNIDELLTNMMLIKNELNDEQVIDNKDQAHVDKIALHKGIYENGNAVETETDVGVPLQQSDTSITEARKRTLHVHKILHTICIYSSMFSIGWRSGLHGPVFPDLRRLVNEDLAVASWIFTGLSLGGIFGAILSGVIHEQIRLFKVFICCGITACLGVITVITPWCPYFAGILALHITQGVFTAIIDTMMTTDIAEIWGHQSGTYMQGYHLMWSIGATISPFSAGPFLAPKLSVPRNDSTLGACNSSILHTNWQSNSSSADCEYEVIYGESKVHFAFMIAAVVPFVTTVVYIVVLATHGVIHRRIDTHYLINGSSSKQTKYGLSARMQVVFTLLSALLLSLYLMCERGLAYFLMTFVTTSLNWSTLEGTSINSAFWITFAAGRAFSLVLLKKLSLTTLLFLNYAAVIVGSTLLIVSIVFDLRVILWLAVCICGLGMSSIYGGIFAWISYHVTRLTGKVASTVYVPVALCAMLYPVLVGYLMERFSQIWLIYVHCIIVVVMSVDYLFVVIAHKRLTSDSK
ncbi:sodium-dependent glucose transporter 1-like isoform X2 [Dreissena polymorpha]|uniref:sodium-dependent glucose transporter 1-like isoform X2 n=1 Tax=Dreissena polymorpha TaxID=45954 RepID=UPI002264C455|nr:sodium-dependent glucose transporter 1-like isoform X2 [Dreissena polymorpha]